MVKPMIAMLILFFVFGIILAICLLTIPLKKGHVCGEIDTVSVGQQPECHPSSSYDSYFFCDHAKAYQYTDIAEKKLEKKRVNSTFSTTNSIKRKSYSVFGISTNIFLEADYRVKMHFELSAAADIYVLSEYFYSHFKEYGTSSYSYRSATSVTSWDFSTTDNDDLYVVVENKGKSDITVTYTGWIVTNRYVMNSSLAKQVCDAGVGCVFSNNTDTLIIIEYEGSDVSVPVEMLNGYGFNLELISVVTIFPIFCACFLFCFFMFLGCWCYLDSVKDHPEVKEDQSEAAPMESVAVGAGPDGSSPAYPGTTPEGAYPGATPEGAYPGATPAGAPPGDASSAGAYPAATPVDASNPAPAYPGQTDIYGIPVAP